MAVSGKIRREFDLRPGTSLPAQHAETEILSGSASKTENEVFFHSHFKLRVGVANGTTRHHLHDIMMFTVKCTMPPTPMSQLCEVQVLKYALDPVHAPNLLPKPLLL